MSMARQGVSGRVCLLLLFLIIALALGLGLGLGFGLKDYRNCDKTTESNGRHNTYNYAAVTTEHGPCSQVGVDILARGGSSVDAMIASFLCLGVVNPHKMGLGGGVNILIYERARGRWVREMKAIIGGETAPLSAHRDMYTRNPSYQKAGPMSMAVPGELNAYKKAWDRYGRLPWKDLFGPAIRMCEEGWRVTASMAASLKAAENQVKDNEMLREAFVKSDGNLYDKGDNMTNVRLGRTLRVIAQVGPGAFYDGHLTDDIIADITDAGGIITRDDLKSNRALILSSLKSHLETGNFTVHTPPSPTSGVLVEFVMKLMDGYKYTPDKFATAEDKVLFYHRMIEAWKIGFSMHSKLGDSFSSYKAKYEIDKVSHQTIKILIAETSYPDIEGRKKHYPDMFAKNPADTFLYSPHPVHANLVGGDFVESMRSSITADETSENNFADNDMTDDVKDHQTSSQVLVYSGSRGGVSATSSIGSLFGCGIVGKRTGIIFNNNMARFDTPTDTKLAINYIDPKKRGRTFDSPIIVLDSKDNIVQMAGATGGSRIITSTSFVSMQNLWLGFNMEQAVNNPRLYHHGNGVGTLYYDDDISEEIREGLKEKGHTDIVPGSSMYSNLGVQYGLDAKACRLCKGRCKDGCLDAVCDMRSEGSPDGF